MQMRPGIVFDCFEIQSSQRFLAICYPNEACFSSFCVFVYANSRSNYTKKRGRIIEAWNIVIADHAHIVIILIFISNQTL